MKRAELSINVVIVAVIAILVLIILAVVLMKGIGQSSETAFACENAGGECKSPESDGGCPDQYSRYFLGDSGCKKNSPYGNNAICCRSQE